MRKFRFTAQLRLTAIFLCLCLCFCSCSVPFSQTDNTGTADETYKLHIHTIDVGQGDSIFVRLPDGATMLIDAGEKEYGKTVVEYIKSLGYDSVTVLVGTHPHADHIGGLQTVMESLSVEQIYLPDKNSTTATYRNLLQCVKDQGKSIKKAVAGKTIRSGDDFSVDILSPGDKDYGDNMNLYSVVIKITYGDKSFLFLGDAETENEREMKNFQANFVKVGHHGSNTSSSAAFVKKTGADIAVVSVGKENSYGLPKEEILKRWTDSGAILYRTDELGTVVARSDGKTIVMDGGVEMPAVQEPDRSEAVTETVWVLNTASKKIHRADCSGIASMAKKNRRESSKSLDELIQEGYSPCGMCDPSEG